MHSSFKYFLLTEFEVRTVKYGPLFFCRMEKMALRNLEWIEVRWINLSKCELFFILLPDSGSIAAKQFCAGFFKKQKIVLERQCRPTINKEFKNKKAPHPQGKLES